MEKKNPILSIVVLLGIVAIAVLVLFLVFKPSDNPNVIQPGTPTATPSAPTETISTSVAQTSGTPVVSTVPTVTPKPTVTVTVAAGCSTVPAVSGATAPGNWKPLENTSQNYTAYRPTGFFYRLFPPDMFILGIDPNPIPTASEYMGVIGVVRLSASNNFNSYLDNLETGYLKCTRVIDGRTWTTVVGKTKTTDAFAGQYIKYAYVDLSGKEYMVRLTSGSIDYGGYADEYETFLTTIQFH